MKPLYRYRLDTENGNISLQVINDYEECKSFMGLTPPIYRFKHKSIMQYVKVTNIDRVCNYSYYTFTEDIDIAEQKFKEHIQNKINIANEEVKKLNNLYNMVHRGE